jgi:hexosaminidase
VNVIVEELSDSYPQLNTDESYTLKITDSTTEEIIQLTAKSVYGVLRGLESLSQLVVFDFDEQRYDIPSTPIYIVDTPRFAHRGMLLDTSRHFQPIFFIQQSIDAISYAKYNVLHWRVVDTQSFPFESQISPLLWKGSYTKQVIVQSAYYFKEPLEYLF